MADQKQEPGVPEAKPEPGTATEHINLCVRSPEGNEIFFKVKRTTGFRKIMTAYCDRTGKSINEVRFTFDGERINPDSTPADLDMEDNDTIDVQLQQVGGSL